MCTALLLWIKGADWHPTHCKMRAEQKWTTAEPAKGNQSILTTPTQLWDVKCCRLFSKQIHWDRMIIHRCMGKEGGGGGGGVEKEVEGDFESFLPLECSIFTATHASSSAFFDWKHAAFPFLAATQHKAHCYCRAVRAHWRAGGYLNTRPACEATSSNFRQAHVLFKRGSDSGGDENEDGGVRRRMVPPPPQYDMIDMHEAGDHQSHQSCGSSSCIYRDQV